mgnify:CR=1 FL=1
MRPGAQSLVDAQPVIETQSRARPPLIPVTVIPARVVVIGLLPKRSGQIEVWGRDLTAASEDGVTERFAGRRVVLAIGKRGTPRELSAEIAPGAEGRVAYFLADARTWAGKRVLVVGLGDSAMEAAVALARQPGTTVTVSYRGSSFARGKSRNIDEVRRMADQGRLRIVWDSEVARVGDGTAVLRQKGTTMTLSVDLVLALIGGVPAWDLVEQAGVRRLKPGPV